MASCTLISPQYGGGSYVTSNTNKIEEATQMAKDNTTSIMNLSMQMEMEMNNLASSNSMLQTQVTGNNALITANQKHLSNIDTQLDVINLCCADRLLARWCAIVYPASGLTGTAFTMEAFAAKKLVPTTRIYYDDTASTLFTNRADSYNMYVYTWVKFSKATSFTTTVGSDDAGVYYLNGTYLGYNASTSTTSLTLNCKAGWNLIEMLLQEGSGGDYIQLGTKLCTLSNYLGATPFYPQETTLEKLLKQS